MSKKPMVQRVLRVPEDLWERAKVRADKRGESLSDAIRQFLERYVVMSEINPIQPPTLTDGERKMAGPNLTFTPEQVENILGARVAAALRDAADHLERFDEVVIGEVEVGSNMIPLNASERLYRMADEVDAS